MNGHNPPTNNEQRHDENPFEYILKRALLHQEGENIDTAQHRSTIQEYRITIEHGSIWLGQECAASPQAMHCQHTDHQERRS